MNCGMPMSGWDAALPFLGMWSVMMAAMMLPSLLPALRRSGAPVGLAGGYFAVWTALGGVLFALGLAEPVLPVGPVLLAAGLLQFSPWKHRHLERCRAMTDRSGLRLGFHCVCSCAGPTAIMLVMGMMDPWVMAAVTTAISAERLAPAGKRIAQATGLLAVLAGLALLSEGVLAAPDFREDQSGVGLGRHAHPGLHRFPVRAQEGIGPALHP